MKSNTISETVDVNRAWKTHFAQNIKINTQDFCIDDFFIINSKIYMSQLQTLHVERVSNMSYFNIMKRKRFLRTSQWKQPNTDKL